MAEENVEVDAGEVKEEVVAEPLNPQTALKQVLKTSLYADGLARGLRESVKALDRHEAVLCILSQQCNEPAYVKLITALCNDSQPAVPLVRVEDGKMLGEWAGLCKYQDGKAVKPVGCSCVVIRKWGEETPAYHYFQNVLKGTAN